MYSTFPFIRTINCALMRDNIYPTNISYQSVIYVATTPRCTNMTKLIIGTHSPGHQTPDIHEKVLGIADKDCGNIAHNSIKELLQSSAKSVLFVQFPAADSLNSIKDGFYKIWNFHTSQDGSRWSSSFIIMSNLVFSVPPNNSRKSFSSWGLLVTKFTFISI